MVELIIYLELLIILIISSLISSLAKDDLIAFNSNLTMSS